MLIARAIAKYGVENFAMEAVASGFVDLASLNNAEREWIKKLDSTNTEKGYNICPGGEGHTMGPAEREKYRQMAKANVGFSFKGRRHTDEAKALISKIHAGKTITPEVIKRRTETLHRNGKQIGPKHHNYGKKCSPEMLAALSVRFSGVGNPMFGKNGPLSPCFGKPQSEYQKQVLSKLKKGVPRTQKDLEAIRKACCDNPERSKRISEMQKASFANNPARGAAQAERMREMNARRHESGIRYNVKQIEGLDVIAVRIRAGEAVSKVAKTLGLHPKTMTRRLRENGYGDAVKGYA